MGGFGVESRIPNKIDRVGFIMRTRESGVPVRLLLNNLRIAPRQMSLADMVTPKVLTRKVPLVQNGQAHSVVLHPDSAAAPGRRPADSAGNHR